MLIIEDPIVTVKCRTTIRALFRYLNMCLSVKLNSFSLSFSSISSLPKVKCPQGSILGPLLFNVFINDIFYYIKHCDLYNYADDNTLSFHAPNFDEVVNVLQQESNILINWFHFNSMQANPEKFQAIAFAKKSFDKLPIFQSGTANISSDEVVKLLVVDIDFM